MLVNFFLKDSLRFTFIEAVSSGAAMKFFNPSTESTYFLFMFCSTGVSALTLWEVFVTSWSLPDSLITSFIKVAPETAFSLNWGALKIWWDLATFVRSGDDFWSLSIWMITVSSFELIYEGTSGVFPMLLSGEGKYEPDFWSNANGASIDLLKRLSFKIVFNETSSLFKIALDPRTTDWLIVCDVFGPGVNWLYFSSLIFLMKFWISFTFLLIGSFL